VEAGTGQLSGGLFPAVLPGGMSLCVMSVCMVCVCVWYVCVYGVCVCVCFMCVLL